MTPFERDIDAQAQAVGRVVAHYAADGSDLLDSVRSLAAGASQVVYVAMGSSRSAALPAATTTGLCWPTDVREAGELLHYGLPAIRPDALVVLVSQSGRSVETVAVAERLQAARHRRLVAVTNDPNSPMATAAQVVLPILAGEEATVATKTWMTTFTVLGLLSESLVRDASDRRPPPASLLPALDEVLAVGSIADGAGAALVSSRSVMVIARGPALAAADYGALIIKETAAMPAECLAGGSFRHGPVEVAGPDVGVVILAPSGRTAELCARLAVDSASMGSPTWLIADNGTSLPAATDRLRVTTLPAVDEAYAPLTMSVPIQRLAARLARDRGREPGVLLRSQKVTDRE
jgi:glucosamine--fructose-6-phosphate aminotransferase (isomerizing)